MIFRCHSTRVLPPTPFCRLVADHDCAFGTMTDETVPIKDKLLKEMRINTHTLLQKYEQRRFDYVTDDSITTNICSVLEAVFVHNLPQKSPYFFMPYSSLSTDQISFSIFLKTFVPKNLLHALDSQTVQRTNIGRCRVWIRACLNEATLHSYLLLCSNEPYKLSQLYSTNALIMDPDFLKQLISLVELLEELRFRLDLTSPMLNSWTGSNALQWLGLQSVHHTNDSLVNFEDSSDLFEDPSEISASCAPVPSTRESFLETGIIRGSPEGRKQYSLGTAIELANDETPPDVQSISDIEKASNALGCSAADSELPKASQQETKLIDPSCTESSRVFVRERQLRRKKKNKREESGAEVPSRHLEPTSQSGLFAVCTQLPSGSNNVLAHPWRKVRQSEVVERDTDWTDTDNCSDQSENHPAHDSNPRSIPVSLIDRNATMESDCSWQVVGEDLLLILTDQDVERLSKIYPGAASFDSENGRNCAFHGECNRCGRLLTPKTAFLDAYDARLYCTNCHQLQETIVPRDVVYNWDFSLQPVSQTTKSFLSGLYHKPVLNLAKLNPTLYAVLPELLNIRQLRRALILLWHQIARCDAKVASDLRRALRPRDYMLFTLNDLDLYSMHDLVEVHCGRLERKITSVLCNVALAHVHGCLACRRRALLCDLCEDLRNPIWPHEVTTYRRCTVPGCHKVMHVSCLVATLADPSVQIGCFGCRAPSAAPGLLNQFDSFVQRCRVCRDYSQVLAEHGVGHYADPFLPGLQTK